MVNKNILFVVMFLGLVFSLGSVNAVITIISPANYTNHTGTATFNVSYVNGTDFTGAVNATFYYNLSGTWTTIGIGICNNGASASSCNGTLTISGLTDGRYSINATLFNNTGNAKATTLTHNVIFDSTAPNVSGYFTSVNRGNYSGVINLNVSVNDLTIGMGVVYLNITHSNGTQVNWTKASASGGYYNVTINTSSFSDGVYNITAYANDSLNNLNKTEMISITIDNTNPSVDSFSCSSSSLTSGETLTCSCSGSDVTSGVFSTTYTASPSTSDTGTYTQTCTITDYPGNSASSTFTYIISSVGSGTSSTASDYVKTIPQNQEEFSEIKEVSYNLKAKERVKLKIENEEHYVGVTDVGEDSATIEVFSTSQKGVFNIGEEKKFEVTGDDYYDLRVTLNSIEGSKANITMIFIHEQIIFEGENEEVVAEPEEIVEIQQKKGSLIWIVGLIGIVVIAIIIYWIFSKPQGAKIKKKR